MAKLVFGMSLDVSSVLLGASLLACGSESGDASTASSTNSPASTASASNTTGSADQGGIVVDGTCKLSCADDSTDADEAGVTDGWGFENGQSCVVPGGVADTGAVCDDPVLDTGPDTPSMPGTGVLINGSCTLVCTDASTDPDAAGAVDGWGYERGVSCVVPGGPSDPGAEADACSEIPAEPTSSTPGSMVLVADTCFSVCMDDSTDADAAGVTDGWGYEDEATCVVAGGAQDTGMPCD